MTGRVGEQEAVIFWVITKEQQKAALSALQQALSAASFALIG